MAAIEDGYSVHLSPEEREHLRNDFDHALDYEFSDAELSFLEEHGYLVLRGIIPTETIDTLVQECLVQIDRRVGVRVTEPSTWSSIPYHGCFDVWHTKTYNLLRQNPLLYSVFAQLLKTGNLTVSVDRVNLKSPCTSEAKSQDLAQASANLELHTDMNYWHANLDSGPIFQGGLCLEDCPEGGGGFFCIPGFQRPERVRQYMAEVNRGKFGEASSLVPKRSKTFVTYLDQLDANANKVEVPLKKGDFVIWNINLPHAGGKNALMWPGRAGNHPLQNWRMHAFIMFVPLDGPCVSEEIASFYSKYQEETRHAITTGERPKHFATRNSTPSGASSAETKTKVSSGPITPLGERILGITPYSVKEE